MNFKGLIENVGVGLLLLLMAPVIIVVITIALPILLFDMAYTLLRKAPNPNVTKILKSNKLDSEEAAKIYVDKIKNTVDGVAITHKSKSDHERYEITSKSLVKRKVVITFDQYSCDIAITGLNSYEWNTADNEGGEIDFNVWIAIGALRNGVVETKSRIGRKNFWVWCDEMEVWCVVQREGSSYDTIHFFKKHKAPERVLRAMSSA